jgi:hypothetical protein
MLTVKQQDQLGKETEKGTENVIMTGKEIGKLKRGLQVEISGSLEIGGSDTLLRLMRGIGLYDITLKKYTDMIQRYVVCWILLIYVVYGCNCNT